MKSEIYITCIICSEILKDGSKSLCCECESLLFKITTKGAKSA